MSSMQPVQEEDFADDIFGAASYEAAPRLKKSFLPWHRPRKQYVRDYQWRVQIEDLLPDLQLNGRPLKYLGLPGIDLLDLRFFHDNICKSGQHKLAFLGFNTAVGPNSRELSELNISLDEVKRLPFILPEQSEVIHDDFKLIAKNNSQAWKKTLSCGPFDIVNLDLCDSIAAEKPGVLEVTHYNAINCLLTLQARRSDPWLLLLTTRVGKGHIHPDVLNILAQCYKQNLEECAAFKETSSKLFSIADEAGLNEVIDENEGVSVVFMAGICKWLLSNTLNQNPQTQAELKSVIGYRVELDSAHLDLVSMAIKFKPLVHPATDIFGLAKHPVKVIRECDQAPKILNRIKRHKDADEALHADHSLHQEMVNGMAELLRLARYDVNGFHDWVRKGCPANSSFA